MRKILFLMSVLVAQLAFAGSYPRLNIMEEGTGTWCQWCVYGIVTIQNLQKDYPDNFCAICIHNNDPMKDPANYDQNLFGGYPDCRMNRSEFHDGPAYSTCKQLVAGSLTADCKVDINDVSVSEDGTKLTIRTTTQFANAESGAAYQLAYVFLEDELGPYSQQNGYAGGGSGEMGGFEKMSSGVSLIYNDVARGIYPDIYGVMGSVPSEIEAGKDYEYTYTLDYPAGISDRSKARLVVLLYNNKNTATDAYGIRKGVIENAARCNVPESAVPETEVTINVSTAGTLSSLLPENKTMITKLVLTGKLNGADILSVRNLLGQAKEIGTNAGSRNLTSLDMGGAQIVTGGVYASLDGSNLTASDNTIGQDMFYGCSSLKELVLPAGTTQIGVWALYDCSKLSRLVIPSTCNNVGIGAFRSCTNLYYVWWPKALDGYLDASIFEGCTRLTEMEFENGSEYVCNSNIVYKTSYTDLVMALPTASGSVEINSACNKIWQKAFMENTNITGLTAEGVSDIGSYAFYGCTALKKVTLGNNVSRIRGEAFGGCTALTKFTCNTVTVPTLDTQYYWDTIGSCDLYVPAESVDAYKSATNWSSFKSVSALSTGIYNLKSGTTNLKPETFNLAGQRVNANASGMVVTGGKKIVK